MRCVLIIDRGREEILLKRARARIGFLAVAAVAFAVAVRLHLTGGNASAVGKQSGESPDTSHQVERVMTLGGSIAKGWMDIGWQNWRHGWHGGYLLRGFDALSKASGIRYTVYDRTIVGANATQMNTLYKGKYGLWLRTVRPQIVVISWGGLNDALPKTPMGLYRTEIRQEILQALNAGAVVLIVTPPVTKAALTEYRVAVPAYFSNEIAVARSLNNPNVYVFNVFDQMEAYIKSHHQSYTRYMANAWHPNPLGHKLAGQLLFEDMWKKFGNTPVRYISSGS